MARDTYEIERYVENDHDDNEVEVCFLVGVGGGYMPATMTDPEEHAETEIEKIFITVRSGAEIFYVEVDDKSKFYAQMVKDHGEDVECDAMRQHEDRLDDMCDDPRY